LAKTIGIYRLILSDKTEFLKLNPFFMKPTKRDWKTFCSMLPELRERYLPNAIKRLLLF